MTFKKLRLLDERADLNPNYFHGLDGSPFTGHVVGKVRPWDDGCHEYVLYEDGDLIIAERAE